MKVFLAGTHSRKWVLYESGCCMKVFLAGGNGKNQLLSQMLIREREREVGERRVGEDENIPCRGSAAEGGQDRLYDETYKKCLPYILESFYYSDADTERLMPYFGDFLLDSGAFTFMQNAKVQVNWEEYIERYADFIKRNKVEKYFELDIDAVVGYEKVLKYRKRLELMVGKPSIPVWHKSRGINEFKKSCMEYPYVAIGGYVVKEITPAEYKHFPQMIDYAHKQGAKIHCLGYTKLDNLKIHHFDSVDSTAWTTGNRFGYYYKFDGKTIVKIEAPKGKRVADPKHCALHNFQEWIKFQKYAETHL